jgi:hypothetical protein
VPLPDAKLWKRLSPLLDELLDLDVAARADHLAAVRLRDAGLADELAAMLDAGRRADAKGFLSGHLDMAAPVLPGPSMVKSRGSLRGAFRRAVHLVAAVTLITLVLWLFVDSVVPDLLARMIQGEFDFIGPSGRYDQ